VGEKEPMIQDIRSNFLNNPAAHINSVADEIAKFISKSNTGAVFQLSGGMITFLIDAISRLGETKIINCRHEQAVGFSAEGLARVSGIPSFAFATSGPGATNLVTAIASSYFDSVPVIYITGQVNQNEIKVNKSQRQSGFQELDITEVVRGITKGAFAPKTPNEVYTAFAEAWKLCLDGRKGPVLIDIPIDVQQMSTTNWDTNFMNFGVSTTKLEKENVEKYKLFNQMLERAKAPLILVGGGVRLDDAQGALRNYMSKTGIPAVWSLMAIDVLESDDILNLGFIGSYGNRWANFALAECDLLIVLGSRLDTRQTGSSVANFIKGKEIVRVDIDPNELDGRVKSDLTFNCGIRDFLTSAELEGKRKDTETFRKKIEIIRETHPQANEQDHQLILNPTKVINWISEVFKNSSGYVVDVGQHQMWAAQAVKIQGSQRFITSGGLGAMGFALPASIGAAFHTTNRWVVLVGDGAFQISSSELQTLVHYNLPITICILNNQQHGMVAQFQSEYLGSRMVGTRDGYSAPNFVDVARAYGVINAFTVRDFQEMKNVQSQIELITGPTLIEFMIDQNALALPKLKYELPD
jgi:acetolactate synthase-1/2/3 large subunit